MSPNMNNLIPTIEKYQKKIPKYVRKNDIGKLFHCIHKLKHLPIEPQHIVSTNVGIDITNLKDIPHGVGEKAQQLLWKWKHMTVETCREDAKKKHKKDRHKEKKPKRLESSRSKKSRRSHHKSHKKSPGKKSSSMSRQLVTDFGKALLGEAPSGESHSNIPFPPEAPETFPETAPKPLPVFQSSAEPPLTAAQESRFRFSLNYKPLPSCVPEREPQKPMETQNGGGDSLDLMYQLKAQRTRQLYGKEKVVGGITQVPSLFNTTMNVLIHNIDNIEATGGIPYHILKPLLIKASANQLFNLEHHNPYLLDDTDELWEVHCRRTFKTFTRQDMESWRDMYLRCKHETKTKLSFLTKRIGNKNESRASEQRRTQLANFSGPPRSARTSHLSQRSSSNSTASAAAVISQRSDVIGPVTPYQRATRPFARAPAPPRRSRPAPNMMKAMNLYKKLHRR